MSSTGLRNAWGGARGWPFRAFVVVAAAVVSLLFTTRAEAYPFMVKHGYSACSTCHADPSGGELLTPYGRALSYTTLSTAWPRARTAKKPKPSAVAPTAPAAQPATAPAAAVPPPVLPNTPATVEAPDTIPPPQATEAPTSAPDTSASAPPVSSPGGAEALPNQSPPADSTAPAPAVAPADATAPAPAGTPPDATAPTPAVAPPDSVTPAPPFVPEPATPPETPTEPPVEDSSANPTPESEEESATYEEEEEISDEPGPLSRPFFGLFGDPERLWLGGSLRFASLLRPGLEGERARFFPMQIDVYGQLSLPAHFALGGSLGVAKVPEGSLHARAAQVTSNQGDGYNLISRTHYARFDFGDHSVRAGRLNLPFGLRISEHVMWVREQTQTDRESDQQHGVALAMNFQALRLEVMGIAGNYQVRQDYYRERGYSAYAEYALFNHGAVGLSSLVTTAADDLVAPSNQRTIRQAHGATLRAAVGEAVFLAEVDLLLRSRRAAGYVGMLQVDYELFRGLHALATGEILDSGAIDGAASREGSGKPRTGAWLSAQWFFAAHFDLRIDAIVRHSDPFQLMTQLHVYL